MGMDQPRGVGMDRVFGTRTTQREQISRQPRPYSNTTRQPMYDISKTTSLYLHFRLRYTGPCRKPPWNNRQAALDQPIAPDPYERLIIQSQRLYRFHPVSYLPPRP
jgi:hypothetical protein